MKKILITGKTSYVGTSFERWCREQNKPFEFTTISVRSEEWKSLDFSPFDAVLHVAGIVHRKAEPALYNVVNRDLVIAVAEKAKHDGIKQFIFLSTMAVFRDGADYSTVTSTTPPDPDGDYGRSKLQAEEQLRKLNDDNFHVASIRPPMIYGKNCPGNFPSLVSIAKRAAIFPKITNRRSMIYIENLCQFLSMVIEDNTSGVFHPQNTEYVNTTDLVVAIRKHLGKKTMTTRLFNPALSLLMALSGGAKKAFGSLVYEKEMSQYSRNYNIVDFDESVHRSVTS
ncbi:MAG: NAD-dependent epimerase/dehydratase family protein [Thermoguttaceae bacterium]